MTRDYFKTEVDNICVGNAQMSRNQNVVILIAQIDLSVCRFDTNFDELLFQQEHVHY